MSAKKFSGGSLVVIWILCMALVLAGFYGLDHIVMNMQGLPLNADLTPGG